MPTQALAQHRLGLPWIVRAWPQRKSDLQYQGKYAKRPYYVLLSMKWDVLQVCVLQRSSFSYQCQLTHAAD